MGVRGRPLSRRGRRWHRSPRAALALTLSALLLALPTATAHEGADPSWWRDLPRSRQAAATPPAARWYDALDLAASAHATRAGSALGAELSVRARLDAASYLARVDAEARDLATIADALERRRHHDAELRWLAARCEGMWRAWQAHHLDLVLATEDDGPQTDPDLAYLHALRDLHGLRASDLAGAVDVRACRLAARLDGLALAAGHPHLVIAHAERSLGERTAAMLAAPAPASAFLHADVRAGSVGPSAGVRFGLDLPIPVATTELGLTIGAEHAFERAGVLSRDAGGVNRPDGYLRLEWQRAGAAVNRQRAPLSGAEPDDLRQLEQELRDDLQRRLLEATLLRSDAERHWRDACGAADADTVVACLAGAAARQPHLGAVLMAVDAELAALHATLAAIDASGHGLAALLGLRR